MDGQGTPAPDSSAVRVALWRALHVQVDPPPHVLEDEIGLRLAAPDAGWPTLAMTYILPLELAEPEERAGYEAAQKGARAAGTPFISFFAPQEMLTLASEAGFKEARRVSAADLTRRYFAGRTDGLRPGSEELLVATT
jgi:O-methyltransferase involved in polyketide biosynthesis